ncbi:MAG: hypothetical protein QM541_01490 [Flavobacterium sp.]|nr:hypothetical protein [Flavobacterium sp.]
MSQAYLKDTTLRDSSYHIILSDEGDTLKLRNCFSNVRLQSRTPDVYALTSYGACKAPRYILVITNTVTTTTVSLANEYASAKLEKVVEQAKIPFLKVHGNVLYDVSYRSSIDTPYAEQDIYQHTIQTYLDITVKDKYPMRLYLTNRFSNSNFFQNFSNINLQFNPQQFSQQIKNKLRDIALNRAATLLPLKQLDSLLGVKRNDYNQLQQWLSSPATLQRLVEEKEKQLLQKVTAKNSILPPNLSTSNLLDAGINKFEASALLLTDKKRKNASLKIDSIVTNLQAYPSKVDTFKVLVDSFQNLYTRNRQKLDSLRKDLQNLENKLRQTKQSINNAAKITTEGINNVSSLKQLEGKLQSLQVLDTVLPKGYKALFAIKSFGIGRNMLDYSELTAKNISVTGVQVEFNPSYYVAVATGNVDYRFRDVIVQQNSPKQYLNIIRFGKGLKEGNHIIASYYFGSRQLYNANSSLPNSINPNYNLVGYSVEAQYKLNKTSYLIAEVAKSSQPYYNRTNLKPNLLAEAVSFNERSNEAYAIKLNTFLPQTATAISATFKRTGNNFQSFSVFTTGAAQTNWMVKVDQPFLKRRLMVAASLRTNDFVNPYVSNNYKSSTVFKSLQASLRLKKWPIITAGYYPSSQLIKLADGQYTENLFYTLIGTVNHTYKYRSTSMNSALVYSRFYNKPTDTGFVYFNTTNILLSQQVFLNKLSVQFNASSSRNTDYSLYVLEANGQYKIKTWLSVGVGIKYNTQPNYHSKMIGYSSNATIGIKQLGEIQFLVDKGFVPGTNRQLVPNNIGRLSYFKIF